MNRTPEEENQNPVGDKCNHNELNIPFNKYFSPKIKRFREIIYAFGVSKPEYFAIIIAEIMFILTFIFSICISCVSLYWSVWTYYHPNDDGSLLRAIQGLESSFKKKFDERLPDNSSNVKNSGDGASLTSETPPGISNPHNSGISPKPQGDKPSPPFLLPSHLDQLMAALEQWRAKGVKWTTDDEHEKLELLRDADDSDAALFVSGDRKWSEIKAARNVLKAVDIGLNAKTLAILPVFVEILIADENSGIKQSVTTRLGDAHFSFAEDRAHAAVVLSLTNNDPPSRRPDCSRNGESYYCADADAALSAVYNYAHSPVVEIPSTKGESELNGNHQPVESEYCAQLDAVLNATDGFIKYVLPGQQRSTRLQRHGCN